MKVIYSQERVVTNRSENDQPSWGSNFRSCRGSMRKNPGLNETWTEDRANCAELINIIFFQEGTVSIGSCRGPDFPLSEHGQGNALRVFLLDLKFPFFDTKSVYIQKLVSIYIFLLEKRLGNRIQINLKYFFFKRPVCKSLTAFARAVFNCVESN